MLLTVPVELQDLILARVPRRDLAAVVRVSRHVHDIAVKYLNAHVELKSLEQVQAFFLFTMALSKGTIAATRHIETKLAEWSHIKTLEIQLGNTKRKLSLGDLPRPLRDLRSDPIHINRLRLSRCSYEELETLSPLLTCFHPSEIGLHQLGFLQTFGSAAVLPSVRSASYAQDDYGSTFMSWARVRSSVGLLLRRMCPNLETIEILTVHREAVERLVQEGIAGKAASFFTIRDKPAGSNVWGDVEDDA